MSGLNISFKLVQVAREMPRTWNLDTPEAQHLLQELTREFQLEDQAAQSDLGWQLSGLDRSGTALYNASPSVSRDDSQAAPSAETPELRVHQVLYPWQKMSFHTSSAFHVDAISKKACKFQDYFYSS